VTRLSLKRLHGKPGRIARVTPEGVGPLRVLDQSQPGPILLDIRMSVMDAGVQHVGLANLRRRV